MKPTVKATAAVEGDVYVRVSASPKRLRPRMRGTHTTKAA
jgi:hypothetical protein